MLKHWWWVLFLSQTFCLDLIADEVLVQQIIQWGDPIDTKNKEGEVISREARPVGGGIGWSGNKLGIAMAEGVNWWGAGV
jgi:hypothetical protein